MRLLYIGNHLSVRGAYPSVAESLSLRLLPELELHLVSRKRNKGLRMLDMLWAILRYGRKEQPVLIDVYSTWNFYYALLCGLLCRMLACRYYCVLHGGNLPRRLQDNPRLSRWLFGGAARLIAPSSYLQAAFRQAGYEVIVIPNAIPLKNYPYRCRKNVRPRILWVRAFSSIYNPQMAIHVLHRLISKYPNAFLCMVGPERDGSQQHCKKLVQELGLSGHVRFTGLLSKSEWTSLSEKYDVFINTTNFDNAPVSVIEAMALGLPVVCTNAGGLPYLVKNRVSGLVVPCGDVKEMSEKIIELIENHRLAESLSVRGRRQVESYDFSVVSNMWKKLLLDC